MKRPSTYVGQTVYEWSLSAPSQYAMTALAKVCQTLFGTTTTVNGLACTPTSPAGMTVLVGPGEIYQMASLEATACGTLPADTAHQILKQGIQLDTFTSSALAAPGTSGQSIAYLIQAQYADQDISVDPTTGNTPVVLQYYNSATPSSPWSGPNNSGSTSNTFRDGVVSIGVKAGAAAATGSQVTPSPDSGYVGLSVVTVAYGQTTITAANIAAYANAPRLSDSLLNQIAARALLNGSISNRFSAANATAATDVVNLGQAQAAFAALAGNVSQSFLVAPASMLTQAPQYQQIPQIQPVAAAVASNALTATLSPTMLQFRSATLNSGTVTPLVIGAALSLVVPSGATLGSAAAVQATYAVLALYNGGTPVLGIVNIAGGVDLSETGLISTTAISSGATSASIVYSTAAVTSSPYRVVGFITATEATAGTWATAPSLVQGAGGEAFGALQSFGQGQTWQNLTSNRAPSTTYYNTTNRPIMVSVIYGGATVNNSYLQANIGGNAALAYGNGASGAGTQFSIQFVVPPGASYSASISAGGGTLSTWYELR